MMLVRDFEYIAVINLASCINKLFRLFRHFNQFLMTNAICVSFSKPLGNSKI